MKLFATLYLDEDVSVLVATLLQARGLDVKTTREQGMLGKSDETQLGYASSLDRCVLTHNRLDFEKLHAESIATEKPHAGIIIAARRNPHELARRVSILCDSLTADEISSQLLYI
jgi:predicted nuclease of predicted toxin-antitoxin system